MIENNFKKQYQKEMEQITPSQDLLNRTKAAMRAELEAKKNQPKQTPKRPAFRKTFAFVAVAAAILLAVFGMSLLNQTENIILPSLPENLFTMRVYAMELQPDGTYVWREVDIALLSGWAGHHDGEALYIGLGLWFDFEGENISTIQFSLEDGFFATQYIGNFGEVPNTPRSHVGIPPCFTTSRLVMYGLEFDKVGSTITFGETMPDDILLFWGNYEMGVDDWSWDSMIIEIGVTVTFECGETQQQPLILDFGSDDAGMGMISSGGGQTETDVISLDWFTREQFDYVMYAPMESFTYVPYALTEVEVIEFEDSYLWVFDFYIGDHTPTGIRFVPFEYEVTGVQRYPMGTRDGIGYVVIVEFADTLVVTARAYSIPLN